MPQNRLQTAKSRSAQEMKQAATQSLCDGCQREFN
jgi:uncharacterized cysteine cluster protein YcgN (CxxCxxCC family)